MAASSTPNPDTTSDPDPKDRPTEGESEDTVIADNGERQVEPGADGGDGAVDRHRDHAEELADSPTRHSTSDHDGRARLDDT